MQLGRDPRGATDGGSTWTRPATATPPVGYDCSESRRTQPSAFGIAIRPDDPTEVYVGTNCGLAISQDSGLSWTFVDPTPGDSASDIDDVLVQAGGASGIVDVCGDDGHLRSTDGGSSWIAGSGLPAGRCSLAASPDESYVVFAAAADNNIYESDDANAAGGATWTNVGTPDRRRQGRIPFVAVNDRADSAFDLWFGDIGLYRGGCTTPAMPGPGGAIRCPMARTGAQGQPGGPTTPPPPGWSGPFTSNVGGHSDVGDLLFDAQTSPDGCPVLYSSDGGVHFNTDNGADCQNPDWGQPDVTPHAAWLFGLAGVDAVGTDEDLYFVMQDNGTMAATDAGTAAPDWFNRDCCDAFDVVADATRVVSTRCCGFDLRHSDPGMTNTTSVANDPPGVCSVSNTSCTMNSDCPAGETCGSQVRSFQFPDFYDQFGLNQYVAVNAQGAFITSDITANPVVWTALGPATTPTAGFCSVQVSMSGAVPSFFANTRCITNNGGIFEAGPGGGQLWRFDGANPAGAWQRIDDNGLAGGIEAFGVARGDPDRIYALNEGGGNPQVVFSTDGGQSWEVDSELDSLMQGGGVFLYQPSRGPTPHNQAQGYTQASLFAFDPSDADVIVAGGRDSGLFLSVNGGESWALLTDPLTPDVSGVPHLPRPWFAYFDREAGDAAGEYRFFVGTQGRGVWRVTVENQPPVCDADGPYVAECAGPTTPVMLDGTGSFDLDGDPLEYAWSGGFVEGTATGPQPTVNFPGFGDFVVDLEVRDPLEVAMCSAPVTIEDTTPPQISVQVSPAVLWPPNHKMVEITASVIVEDVCDSMPTIELTSITSSEPDDASGGGDGHTVNDIQGAALGTADFTFLLRAERQGSGPGRTYTVTYTATDAAGNEALASAEVSVPHSQGGP